MIRKKTWILLGTFAVVLGAYLMWQAARPSEPAVKVTPSPEPLWSVASQDIIALIVEDLGANETLELRRDEADLWQIVAPQAGPADAARVERAVSWLASPSPRSELLDVPDLGPFRLDAPLFRVEIVLKDGSRQSFQVGRGSPTGGSRYVSMAGRAGVMVVSDFGLDEVLTLRDDLLATPTPEAQPTGSEEMPMGTEQPTQEGIEQAVSPTPEETEAGNG